MRPHEKTPMVTQNDTRFPKILGNFPRSGHAANKWERKYIRLSVCFLFIVVTEMLFSVTFLCTWKIQWLVILLLLLLLCVNSRSCSWSRRDQDQDRHFETKTKTFRLKTKTKTKTRRFKTKTKTSKKWPRVHSRPRPWSRGQHHW